MKVKIIRCSDNRWWYSDLIGECFSVVENCGEDYMIENKYAYDKYDVSYLYIEDCVDITRELKLERILNEN